MSSAGDAIRLGDERPWGETICGYGLDRPECDQPAAWHVLWLKDNWTSTTCDEHLAFIRSRDTSDTPYEIHSFGPNCGMPGTLWHHPYEDEEEGYCLFPAVDDASLLAEEDVPASR